MIQAPGTGRPTELDPATSRWLDPATSRWLAWHEAVSHGLIGREIRDLGDAGMLYDPNDREPFWNRIAGIAWPDWDHTVPKDAPVALPSDQV